MRITYLLLLFLLLSCCQTRNTIEFADSKDIANVEIKEYPFEDNTIFDSDKYFDSIRYVFLEETKESIVPSIGGLFFVDDMILVVSKRAGSIFFFDNSGKYLHKINKKGRGHGEYLTQENVMVDAKRKKIMVYDNDTNKVHYYDFYGNHLKTISNFSDDALVRDVINMHDGSFICYNPVFYEDNDRFPAGVWKVDSNGRFDKYIYQITEYYPHEFAVGLVNLTTLNEDTIGFVDSNTGNTYHIVNDSLFCRSRYKMPEKTRADYVGSKETNEEYTFVFNYQEKGSYIFMIWGTSGRLFTTILSKSGNTVETGLSFSPIMNKYTMLGGRYVYNNGLNILTSWVDYEVLKNIGDKHPDNEVSVRIKQILAAVPQTTNPVIQISYVKSKNAMR